MSQKNQTKGAFGGLYKHEVIRQLRAQLAQSNLILSALVEHTKIGKEELQRIASEFLSRKKAEIDAGKG